MITSFLTTKDAVFLYPNEDGKSGQRRQILRMVKPDNVYDHAGILGVTWSPDQWLYVSRGNTGSSGWRIEGTDGTFLEGYGDGGNVFRCRADGTQLTEVATGFWNPFGLQFTQAGRLLLTDNDPDSRGPNRLIEVVPGGNYGYQSLYGGSGIHPFLAWNGELPGTLPFAAALGEAPCGLINANVTNFSSKYTNSILVSVWEENKIVSVPLQPYQSTVRGEAELFVQGDITFHPVALAANGQGDLYVTDWVVRQYPNHGRGRIWRLTSASDQTPVSVVSRSEVNSSLVAWLSHPEEEKTKEQWVADWRSDDPFVQAVARKQLGKEVYHQDLVSLLQDPDSEIRLQALLTLLEASMAIDDHLLIGLLHDKREDVRRMCLTYIATLSRTSLENDVHQALIDGYIRADLFETYLATVRHLQPEFVRTFTQKSSPNAHDLKRELPKNFIWSLVSDRNLPEEIRTMALPYLEEPTGYRSDLLAMLTQPSEEQWKIALLKTLKTVVHQEVAKGMLAVALDQQLPASVRAQALVLLDYQSATFCREVISLLKENDESLPELAIRYLCTCRTDQNMVTSIENLIERHAQNEVSNVWNFCQGRVEPEEKLTTDEAWTRVVDGSGVPEKGQWVFQSSRAQCQTCHRVNGFGGAFGPDLSKVGSSKSEQQLITAILEPSQEISPEWQGWFVTTRQGQTHYGRQIERPRQQCRTDECLRRICYLSRADRLRSGSYFTHAGRARTYLDPIRVQPPDCLLTIVEINKVLMSLRTNRRSFVKSASALLASVGTSWDVSAAPQGSAQNQSGIIEPPKYPENPLVLFDNFHVGNRRSYSWKAKFAAARHAGFDGFEFAVVDPDSDAWKEAMDHVPNTDFTIWGFHWTTQAVIDKHASRIDEEIEKIEKNVALCAELPIKPYFTLSLSGTDELKGSTVHESGSARAAPRHWERAYKIVAAYDQSCQKYGVTGSLYPHIHWICDTPQSASRILKGARAEWIGPAFCSHHWYGNPASDDLEDVFNDPLMQRLNYVVLTNGRFNPTGFQAVRFDEGEIDMAWMLAQLYQFGYEGPISSQGWAIGGDPLVAAQRFVDGVKQLRRRFEEHPELFPFVE